MEDDNSNCSVYYDISYFLCRNICVCVSVRGLVGWEEWEKILAYSEIKAPELLFMIEKHYSAFLW